MSSTEEREGEEIERESSVSELVTTETGARVIKITLTTGKTSAARLFGKYGREGRPDFFRIVFGAIANSLRKNLGDEEGTRKFNEIKNSPAFKDSMDKIFNDMKNWFFNEVIKKYDIGKGDVFVITTELDLNIDTGEVTWNKDNSQVIYWVRSDKIKAISGCGELEEEVKRLREENERLKAENERLQSELNDIKSRLNELMKILGSGR